MSLYIRGKKAMIEMDHQLSSHNVSARRKKKRRTGVSLELKLTDVVVPTAHCQYTLMQASTKGVVRGATGLRALLIKEPHLNEGELRDIYLEAQRHISQVFIHAEHPSAFSISENIHISSPFSHGGAPAGWAGFERLAEFRQMCPGILGVSCNSLSEVGHAFDADADYVTLSSTWLSGVDEGNQDSSVFLGLKRLRQIQEAQRTNRRKNEAESGELAQRSTMCFFQGEVTPEKFKHLVEKGTEGVVVHQELWFREDEKIFLELLKQYLDLLPSDENFSCKLAHPNIDTST
eukprot:jgi/Bigna1/74771/fgenesh1_pg.30_\